MCNRFRQRDDMTRTTEVGDEHDDIVVDGPHIVVRRQSLSCQLRYPVASHGFIF